MPFVDKKYRFMNRPDYEDEEFEESKIKSKTSDMVHLVGFQSKTDKMIYFILAFCVITAFGVGVYLQTREITVVAADFCEVVPEKKLTPAVAPEVNRKSISADPRSRVKKKGVLGVVSGEIKGKTASADVFAKGGFASNIDAVISGVGGVKSAGGRKETAGIGYGSGYGGAKRRAKIAYMRGALGGSDAACAMNSAMNTEEYDHIQENGFRQVNHSPLSTFSIDVDVASYSNMRRFLTMGRLPPADAVRIEEMINYFTYSYDNPTGDDPFSVTTEAASCPWNDENKLVLVGIQGRKMDQRDIPPSNLVFLVDVSGSMGSANKLFLVKKSMKLLVNKLRQTDRVSIVVYAGAAGLVLPSTPGSDKDRIIQAIDNLRSGGSTAGGQGIKLAYKIARENFRKDGNNRVVLATDGDFNVGASSDGELVRLIEKERKSGVFLTVLGYGMGNYKDSKMEKLADKGNGNYAYIDNLSEARKVLVREMGGTLFTIAKDVKIQVEFNPALISEYRLIGYENRLMAKEDFNDDKKDAGELGAGHSVTALYEVVPVGAEKKSAGVDELKYQKTEVDRSAYGNGEMMTVKLRYKKPDQNKSKLLTHVVRRGSDSGYMSENLGFATAVAGFGMILRNSEYKGDLNADQVSEQARRYSGRDSYGYRSEFVKLVQKYSNIAKRG
ncbi:MAG: vWA domain-containing protein [Chitinispirillaceae bacterium]